MTDDASSPGRRRRCFSSTTASTRPELEDAADLAIKRAYYTELTVDEALARIDRETAPLLERARQDGP